MADPKLQFRQTTKRSHRDENLRTRESQSESASASDANGGELAERCAAIATTLSGLSSGNTTIPPGLLCSHEIPRNSST